VSDKLLASSGDNEEQHETKGTPEAFNLLYISILILQLPSYVWSEGCWFSFVSKI